jgi:transposase-like protein
VADAYLTNPIFNDDAAARAYLEALRWPHGPQCPHCGVVNEATAMKGKSHRPGLYQCNACRDPFTVTVGTVYERSKIPLHKWLMATYLIATSRKGMSSKQIERVLGVTYKTAWFMTHRIREAMRDTSVTPMGGEGKAVEVDETYMGGKDKNRHMSKRVGRKGGKGGKHAVVSLVERDGKVRSFHVTNVNAANVRPIVLGHVMGDSNLMTDESPVYTHLGTKYATHEPVNHSKDEYAQDAVRHARPHQLSRGFLRQLEARDLRRVPQRQRASPASLPCGIRSPLQRQGHDGPGTHRCRP